MSTIVATALPLLPDSTFVIFHENDTWISQTNSFVDIINDDDEDDVDDDRSLFRTVIEVFAVAVVSIGIIISNIINLVVLSSLGTSMPWTTRMFLINLSVSDLLVGVVACAPAVVPTYAGRWMYGDTWCQVSGVTHGTSVTISIWSISMVGLYRYAATALPMRYRKLVAARSKRCYAIVAAMWAAALITFAAPLLTKPDFVYYRYSHAQRMCGLHWEYPLYAAITGFYIPILSGAILIFTGYRISSTLSQRAAKAAPSPRPVACRNGSFDRSMQIVHREVELSPPRLPQSQHCQGLQLSPSPNPRNADDGRPDEGDDMEMNELPPSSHAQTSGTNVASSVLLTIPDGASSASRVPTSTAFCSGDVPVSDTHLNKKTEPKTVPLELGSKLRWASGSRRTLRILIYTGIAYFTCWGPYVTIVYVRCFAPSWRPPSALEFILIWLANANSALNVFIYSSTNAAFRRHCIRLGRRLLPCSSRPSRKGAAGGSTRGAPSSAAGYSIAPVFEPSQQDHRHSGESVAAYVEIPVVALTPRSLSQHKTVAQVKVPSSAVILGERESEHLPTAQTSSLRDRKFDQPDIGNNMFLTIPSVNVNRNAKWIDMKRRHV